MGETLTPKDYQSRVEAAGRWKLGVTSYKLGDHYVCRVDNVDPGATLARANGKTREDAEAKALEQARYMVGNTRTFD
jgi:DNA-binding IclR family transcriptional regulator